MPNKKPIIKSSRTINKKVSNENKSIFIPSENNNKNSKSLDNVESTSKNMNELNSEFEGGSDKEFDDTEKETIEDEEENDEIEETINEDELEKEEDLLEDDNIKEDKEQENEENDEEYKTEGKCFYNDVEDEILIDDINELTEDVQEEEIVNDENRITKAKLTIYERVRILGLRAKQISLGAKILIKNPGNKTPLEIAELELIHNVLPYKIKRVLPNNLVEIWKLSELVK